MTRKRALLVGLALLPGVAMAGIAAARAGVIGWGADPSGRPLSERYEAAASWDSFLEEHAREAEAWRAGYDRAEASIAPYLAERPAGGPWRLLVVTEEWCGDSRRTVPYLARLAAERPDLELRIAPRRAAPDLLATYTAPEGREAIPLVLVLDGDHRIRGAWVEQPAPLRALIERESGTIPADALHDRVLAWYAADAGRTALAEITALMR